MDDMQEAGRSKVTLKKLKPKAGKTTRRGKGKQIVANVKKKMGLKRKAARQLKQCKPAKEKKIEEGISEVLQIVKPHQPQPSILKQEFTMALELIRLDADISESAKEGSKSVDIDESFPTSNASPPRISVEKTRARLPKGAETMKGVDVPDATVPGEENDLKVQKEPRKSEGEKSRKGQTKKMKSGKGKGLREKRVETARRDEKCKTDGISCQYAEVMKKLDLLQTTLDNHRKENEAFKKDVLKSLANIESEWAQMKSPRETDGGAEVPKFEDANKPPGPGFKQHNDSVEMIHCGQGIWMPLSTFNNAVYNARSNGMFVKNMAVAIFGMENLKNSSVTGSVSNRTKAEAKPPLDPVKALAVRDIFEFYLKSHRRITDEEKVRKELDEYTHYIGQKISDLNRAVKPKKGTNVKKINEKKTETNSSEDSEESESNESDKSNSSQDEMSKRPRRELRKKAERLENGCASNMKPTTEVITKEHCSEGNSVPA